jgi:hypothetical protein
VLERVQSRVSTIAADCIPLHKNKEIGTKETNSDSSYKAFMPTLSAMLYRHYHWPSVFWLKDKGVRTWQTRVPIDTKAGTEFAQLLPTPLYSRAKSKGRTDAKVDAQTLPHTLGAMTEWWISLQPRSVAIIGVILAFSFLHSPT